MVAAVHAVAPDQQLLGRALQALLRERTYWTSGHKQASGTALLLCSCCCFPAAVLLPLISCCCVPAGGYPEQQHPAVPVCLSCMGGGRLGTAVLASPGFAQALNPPLAGCPCCCR